MLGDTTQDPWGFPSQGGPDPRDPTSPGTPNSDPWSADDLAAARSYYTDWMGQRPTIGQYGTLDNVLDAYKQARSHGQAHDAALQGGLDMLGWTGAPTSSATAPPPTPAPGGGGGGGGGGYTGPDLTSPWGGGPFAPPTPTPYPTDPTFTQPTMEEAANDPGYQFSRQQGETALKNWQAAHGTYNDSSAVEALQQFGQNAAGTQYGNVWDRKYKTYQGAQDTWKTDVARTEHDNDQGWQNAFNTWLQNWNIWKDQRDSTFNKRFAVTTA